MCRFVVTIIFLVTAYSVGTAQRLRTDFVIHSASDSILIPPDSFLIIHTIKLHLDSTIELTAGVDYTIVDSDNVTIVLSPELLSLLYSNSTTSKEHRFTFEAEIFQTSLKRNYSFFDDVNFPTDSLPAPGKPKEILTDEQPTSHSGLLLEKSGGITRGLQVGSSQDATFTNSFNLTFNGSLADEFTFKGALSEESTPLQPEGNTQTLRDIDRVFIEIRAKQHFSSIIGDQIVTLNHIRLDSLVVPTVYDNFSRKVLGATATIQYGPTALLGSYSVTKGSFVSNAIAGIDAVQGPYRLSGRKGERAIIVIAGTEKVYLDGELLKRGEQYDYTIDYGLAEIIFTTKKIITASSRITVDFEYTDERYSRNLLAVKQVTSVVSDAITFSTSYLREGDDQDNPRELSLSDSDRAILKNAGTDETKAAKSGVSIVSRDSLGRARGSYIAIDTVINNISTRFYRYAPSDTLNAIYSISFGRNPNEVGSYIRKNIGEYQFVGAGLGEWDTLYYLPLPRLHQLLSSKLTAVPFDGLLLSAEGAITSIDKNRFAQGSTSNGEAYDLKAEYNILQKNDSSASLLLSASSKYTAAAFLPFDRIRTVESMRGYGIENSAFGTEQTTVDEREHLIKLGGTFTRLTGSVSVGDYSLGNSFYHATHYTSTAGYNGDSAYLPNISAYYELTNVQDSNNAQRSKWQNAGITLLKNIGEQAIITPSFAVRYSDRRSTNNLFNIDSLIAQSFRYTEFIPMLNYRSSKVFSISASYLYRIEDSSRSGIFTHISESSKTQLSGDLNLSNFSTRFDVGIHERTYYDSISRARNGGDNSSLLIHLVPRYHSSEDAVQLEADYQASQQRSATVQRLFFTVQPGQGNYRYLGDLNNNGKQDAEEFELARYTDQGAYILLTIPSETLTPTVDLKSTFRLRLRPSLLNESSSFKFLSPISMEIFARFENNSIDPTRSQTFLDGLTDFEQDTNSLRGLREFQSDFFLFENNQDHSFRVRFHELTGSTQYTTGTERFYRRDLSLLSRLRFSNEWRNETTVEYDNENVTSNAFSTNRPQETKKYKAVSTVTFEPFDAPFDFSMVLSLTHLQDSIYLDSRGGFIHAITYSSRFHLSNDLRLKAEIGRTELTVHSKPIVFLPYGITSGLTPGITWNWSLGVDQEITRGLILNATYEGRSELSPFFGGRHITHIGRAEIRASF